MNLVFDLQFPCNLETLNHMYQWATLLHVGIGTVTGVKQYRNVLHQGSIYVGTLVSEQMW